MRHPFIIGNKVYLRAIEESDYEQYIDWFNNQETTKYMEHGIYPNSYDRMKVYYEAMKKDNLYLAICTISKDNHIGNISLTIKSQTFRAAEVSIILGECRKHGYGSEAVWLVVNHAYSKMNLNRVQAGMAVDNVDSYNLFKKIGFQEEGVIRDLYYVNGAYQDCYMLSILKKEWRAVNNV